MRAGTSRRFSPRVNERLPDESKSPATLLRELYDMLVARKFPDVEARLAKLRALSLDVPELTRGSVQLALTTSNLTYPILAFEDDPEEREPRPVIRQATLQGYSGPSLSGRLRKSVGGGHAASGIAGAVVCCWCWSILVSRSSRSAGVNFHWKGRAVAL